MLAGVAAALLAAIVAVAWLVTTEAGLRKAVSLVESVGAISIRVEGASGRLIGPLRIDAVEIDHPRAAIRIAGLQADYEPLEILAGRLSAEGARIARADVGLRPATGPKRPPSFLPGWLTVVVDDAAVADLRLVSPTGTEIRFRGIRGSAKLTKSQIEFEGVSVRSQGWAVAGASGSLYAREPLALDVNAAWSLADDDKVFGILRAAGDLDRLMVDGHVAKPATARVTAEVTGLGGDLAWRGKAEIEKLDLAQWIEKPPFGPLAATLAIAGDRASYGAEGVVRGAGLPEAGARVDARTRYADSVLAIDSLVIETAPASVVSARGTMTVGEQPSFDVAADWTGLRWPLTGRALIASSRGKLAAEGWTEFSYRVEGAFEPPAVPPFAGHAAGRFTAEAIAVDESAWRVLGGRVSLEGALGRGDSPAWNVSGRATDIDPSKLRGHLPGRISFDFSGSGRGFEPDGPWFARVRNLSGEFRGQPLRGSGGIRRGAGRTEFQAVRLALGPARLELDGSLGKGADLDASAVSEDLSAFLPELGGRVNATVQVRERTVSINFTGHDLAYGSHSAVVLSADAQIDRDNQEHSYLRLRSNGITLAGLPITDTRLSLDGLPQDHALNFRVGAGSDAVSLRGRGAYVSGRYTLELEDIAASGPRIVPWRLESESRLTASREAAALEPLCVAYESRRLCMQGRWRDSGDWEAKASTEAFPLEALHPKRLGTPRYRGILVADAEASGGAGRPWIANLRAEIRDASLVYQSASGADRKVELGLTRLTLISDTARHRLDLRVSDADDLDLAVNLAAQRVQGERLGELPISGSVRGSTRQLSLLPLLVDAIDNASGELALDFTVAGRVAAPQLQGEARLAGGTLDFYQANLRLRELRAAVRLEDTSLTFDAAGKAGEGSLAIDGRLGWRGRKLKGEMTMTGERLLVANVPEARVFASPDLRFSIDDHRVEVSGEVAIPEARIRPADTAGVVLASSDERIVLPQAEETAGEAYEVATQVRISLGKKVSVKAYGLSATVTGSVSTQTAPHESTTASGELEVTEGQYSAYGRELEVERGRLLFTGGPVTDPGVDLRATRELPGYKVGVIARGPLRRPQLTLFSEPSLPQAQIASMLIVGRSNIQGDPGADDSSLSATEQGGAFLAGQLGKYVGLDDIGVTQDADTGAELVIGKYLSPRLYVSYGISLVEEINTLKLRYTIGDRWTLSTESGLEQAFDVEYRIED
ncbi:MAG: translocation/assembly module TamB domain-containing protein [Steroidobacteraceae bacterium]